MLTFCFSCSEKQQQETSDNRPNILVLMLDDMGYSDLGCYGGEIRTPNIDAIAQRGIRFTNFKTSPMCAPTRAMFISGNNNVVAGHGRMLRPGKDDFYIGKEGYESNLSDKFVGFPQLLKDVGYYNAVVGKWHLGYAPSSDPTQQGFDDSWILMEGYANHFNNRGLGLNGRDTLTEFRNNGQIVPWPKEAFSTEFYTDKMVDYLNKANTKNKPFFAWASYTAPHWPLQLPDDWLAKDLYNGVYDDGYEALRQKRLVALKTKGIIDKDMELPSPMDNFPAWESLSEEQKKQESRKMELYAGMVENADYHIGRLIQTLKENGQYDNTFILVLSDNGASNTDFYNHKKKGDYCRLHHSNDYENMGKPSSWVGHGNSWANAMMSPFNGYKTWATEGGISAPLIVSGPSISGENSIKKEVFSVLDLAPTFLELAKTSYPTTYEGKEVAPISGKSLVAYWEGQQNSFPHDANTIFAAEQRDHAFLRKGDWKIVNFGKAGDNEQFQLFNMKEDLGERNNLAKKQPDIKSALINDWEKFKMEVGMFFPKKN